MTNRGPSAAFLFAGPESTPSTLVFIQWGFIFFKDKDKDKLFLHSAAEESLETTGLVITLMEMHWKRFHILFKTWPRKGLKNTIQLSDEYCSSIQQHHSLL